MDDFYCGYNCVNYKQALKDAQSLIWLGVFTFNTMKKLNLYTVANRGVSYKGFVYIDYHTENCKVNEVVLINGIEAKILEIRHQFAKMNNDNEVLTETEGFMKHWIKFDKIVSGDLKEMKPLL